MKLDFDEAIKIKNDNSKARRGDSCICPICLKRFVKMQNKLYCGSKCSNEFRAIKIKIEARKIPSYFTVRKKYILENITFIDKVIKYNRTLKKGGIAQCPICKEQFIKKSSRHNICCTGYSEVYCNITRDASRKNANKDDYYSGVNSRASKLINTKSSPLEIVEAYFKARKFNLVSLCNIKDMLGKKVYDILDGKVKPTNSFYRKCEMMLFMNVEILKKSFERNQYV